MVVDALGAAEDLLAAHVEVVGVAVAGAGGGHGVEGADGEGVLVEYVEVGAVFLEDELAELFLLGCAVLGGRVRRGFNFIGEVWCGGGGVEVMNFSYLRSSKSPMSTPASRSMATPSEKASRGVLPASGSWNSLMLYTLRTSSVSFA